MGRRGQSPPYMTVVLAATSVMSSAVCGEIISMLGMFLCFLLSFTYPIIFLLQPEQYWECTQWRQPAEPRRCPGGFRFSAAWQSCQPHDQFRWTPFSEPPTLANAYLEDECVEVVLTPPDNCPPGTWNPNNPTTVSPQINPRREYDEVPLN